MTKLLLFCPVGLFSFALHFLTSLIKVILWLEFSCRQKAGGGHGGGKTIGSRSVSGWPLVGGAKGKNAEQTQPWT